MIRRLRSALVLAVRAVAATAAAMAVLSCNDATDPAPHAIAVQLGVAQLEQGDTTQVSVLTVDFLHRPIDTSLVAFSSSNTAVARVDRGGRVMAIAAGVANISADVRGTVGTASLTVVATVASVTLSMATSTFDVSDSARGTPAAASLRGFPVTGRTFAFTTGNAAVATVNTLGFVRGVSVGTATITATVDGKSGTAPVTIQARPASLRIEPAAPRLNASDTVQLATVALDSAGNVLSGRTTVWSSADAQRVFVNAAGRAAWNAPGRTVVTARSGSAVATTVVSTAGDFAIASVTFTQGVQDSAGSAPLVSQGRPAAVLVNLSTTIAVSAGMDVVLKVFDAQGNVTFTATARPAEVINATPSLAQPTVRMLLPAAQIRTGLRWQVVRDPLQVTPDDNAATDSFPRAGPANLLVADVPPLNVKFIPITLLAHGNSTPALGTGDLPGYLQTVQNLLPVGRVTGTVGAPVATSASFGTPPSGGATTFWSQVLLDVNLARVSSELDPTVHWYGAVGPPAGFNFTQFGGLAYVPLDPTATGSGTHVALGIRTGWAFDPAYARDLVAHELSHNFGRRHAPCGGAAGPDPGFPQSNGTIGQLQHDVAGWNGDPSTPIATIAATTGDLMGYCSPKWLSAYNYKGIVTGRGPATTSGLIAMRSTQPATDVIVLQGSIRLDGTASPTVLPAVAVRGYPVLPDGTGDHRLQGFDAAGALLFDYAFTPSPVDHAPELALFTFALRRDATVDRVARLRVAGPSGATVVDDTANPYSGAPLAARDAAGTLTASCGDASARVALQDDATGDLIGVGAAGSITVITAATRVSVSCARAVRTSRRAFVLR